MIKYVLEAIHFGEKARREGLLALEELIDEEKIENRNIFHYGLRFVIDGTQDIIIDNILSNLIKYNPKNIKLQLMQKEAVLAIQQGLNTRTLAHLLGVFLSSKEFKKLKSQIDFE
jgi:flagellar motor component MotA